MPGYSVAQSAEDEVIRLKQSMGEQAVQSRRSEAELNAEEKPAKEDGLPGHWNFSVGTSYYLYAWLWIRDGVLCGTHLYPAT